ncbi:MAG: acetyl-CoA carboxylase, carboxyltransferase subunit beta [Verrucomicrobiota bacterium]
MAIFKKPPFGGGDKKRDMPEGLWSKCGGCSELIHALELKQNLCVCPKCSHHFRMNSQERIESTVDRDTFEELDTGLHSIDSLGFLDYGDKVERNRKKTGLDDAVVTGRARISRHPVTLSVMDFRFLGASMGSVVGEKITRAVETATAERAGTIIYSASGGARMHEGILSLMQMAKTSAALARHKEAGLPFISVLTDPTYGGVTASFSTLGDVIIAEPGCMIGFAGPRVIKETTHQELPEGFQTAEFMMEHGLVDMIVDRRELRNRIGKLLNYMMPAQAA